MSTLRACTSTAFTARSAAACDTCGDTPGRSPGRSRATRRRAEPSPTKSQAGCGAPTMREMKLFVCYGTFSPQRHPCGKAYEALADAGYAPEVVKTYGCYRTDPLFAGRRRVKHLTGNYKVPTLVLDDGAVIDESQNIVAWAKANPAQRGGGW